MIRQSKANILLMTRDDAAVEVLNAAVNKNPHVTLAAVCREISEFTAYLRQMKLQAAVIDIDPDPVRILHDLDTVTTMYPEMRVVVVSSGLDKDLILQAMHSGARHFLNKATIDAELNEVLKQIGGNGSKIEGRAAGVLITVFSAGGGCGATTVAVNLANELRIASSKEVLVVDLDEYYGTVSSYLGVSPEYGLSNVLAHPEAIDEHLIKSCACSYENNLHVLANPENTELVNLANSQDKNITNVLKLCRNAFKYTVVDAPRLSGEAIRNLASLSTYVVVVFQPTVKDVRFARSLTTMLKSRIPAEKIILLANRFEKSRILVGLNDIKQVLGHNSIYCLRSSWEETAKSVNSGKLLAEIAPKSKLRRDFLEFTKVIIDNTSSKDNS